MSSLWETLYDGVKDRRYGVMFFATTAVCAGMAVVAIILYQAIHALGLESHLPAAAAVLGLLLLTWVCRGVRLIRKRRREGLRFPPLSRDEWRKARSKLVNKQTRKSL